MERPKPSHRHDSGEYGRQPKNLGETNQADAIRFLIEKEMKNNQAIRSSLEFIENKIESLKEMSKDTEKLRASVRDISMHIIRGRQELASLTNSAVKEDLEAFITWLEQNRERWLMTGGDTLESADIIANLEDQREKLMQIRELSRGRLTELWEKEDELIRLRLESADKNTRHTKEKMDQLIENGSHLPIETAEKTERDTTITREVTEAEREQLE